MFKLPIIVSIFSQDPPLFFFCIFRPFFRSVHHVARIFITTLGDFCSESTAWNGCSVKNSFKQSLNSRHHISSWTEEPPKGATGRHENRRASAGAGAGGGAVLENQKGKLARSPQDLKNKDLLGSWVLGPAAISSWPRSARLVHKSLGSIVWLTRSGPNSIGQNSGTIGIHFPKNKYFNILKFKFKLEEVVLVGEFLKEIKWKLFKNDFSSYFK